jgi:hypothetical protein
LAAEKGRVRVFKEVRNIDFVVQRAVIASAEIRLFG